MFCADKIQGANRKHPEIIVSVIRENGFLLICLGKCCEKEFIGYFLCNLCFVIF